jgi:hypothetical protein
MADEQYAIESATSAKVAILQAKALATKRVDSERRKSIQQILDTVNRETNTEAELGQLYKHRRSRRRKSSGGSQASPKPKQIPHRRKSLPTALLPLPVTLSLEDLEKKQAEDENCTGLNLDDGSPLSSRVQLEPVDHGNAWQAGVEVRVREHDMLCM